jgi:hypothetical protein
MRPHLRHKLLNRQENEVVLRQRHIIVMPTKHASYWYRSLYHVYSCKLDKLGVLDFYVFTCMTYTNTLHTIYIYHVCTILYYHVCTILYYISWWFVLYYKRHNLLIHARRLLKQYILSDSTGRRNETRQKLEVTKNVIPSCLYTYSTRSIHVYICMHACICMWRKILIYSDRLIDNCIDIGDMRRRRLGYTSLLSAESMMSIESIHQC